MAKTITLEFKKTACKICSNADKRALRQGRSHCTAPNARMRNGHCTEFKTTKPKFLIQRIGAPSTTSTKFSGDCPFCSFMAAGSRKAVQAELEGHVAEEHQEVMNGS